MAGQRAGQHGARARLALIGQEGRPPAPGGGWVPQAPAAEDADPATPRGDALASALRTYSATYGHPLEHPTVDTEPAARRWATDRRVVVAALVVLTLVCAAVLARGAARMPSTTIDAALPATGASARPGGAPGASTGTEVGAPGDLRGGAPGVGGPADRPDSGPPDPGVPTVPPDGALAGGTASGAVVVVHVVGQVVTPGVISLPVGSRVVDAVAAAGGATADADLSVVNLARVVVDGEQVLVPRPGEPPPPPPSGAASGTGPAVVDLNTADVAALDTLPGIGPVLAQRILDWRTDHGRFTSVEELGEVQGIGPALLAGLRDVVRV